MSHLGCRLGLAILVCCFLGRYIQGCQGGSEQAALASQSTSIAASADGGDAIGEQPAITAHMAQAGIDSGQVQLPELRKQGEMLFSAIFNVLDGQGRPASTGTGEPRVPIQPAFIRTSGPEANSCFGCHNQPRLGGAGDIVANVFVMAQARDPVTTSVDPSQSDERNTLGVFGSGPIEMLAREMTAQLISIRDGALKEAQATGRKVSRALSAKGIGFGTVAALPDGRIDPTGIQGVDWDCVVKPFHQKGAVVSLREFSNNALNHHHGMQSVERFGAGVDADLDGKVDEVSVGDVTAITVFQASLPVPGRAFPASARRRAAADAGEQTFARVGCTDCHVPALTLETRTYSEPNPYNVPGNLRPIDVPRPFSFDMTTDGPGPHIEQAADGRAVVRAYTDLKRHDLTDADFTFYGNEIVPQGTLNGQLPPGVFTVAPAPRPTAQFLTRKLWDAGNSAPYGHRGDLTTLTGAIHFHGGEARRSRDAFFALPKADQAGVIEFLKTLQVLPEGSSREIVQ